MCILSVLFYLSLLGLGVCSVAHLYFNILTLPFVHNVTLGNYVILPFLSVMRCKEGVSFRR